MANRKRPARKSKNKTQEARNQVLHARVQELEDTLTAIREGSVDALVISAPTGDQVFTLQGAEHPYRVLVETINEGAATLDAQGTVLYANARFAVFPWRNSLARRFRAMFHPQRTKNFGPWFKRVLATTQKVK